MSNNPNFKEQLDREERKNKRKSMRALRATRHSFIFLKTSDFRKHKTITIAADISSLAQKPPKQSNSVPSSKCFDSEKSIL